VYVDQAVFSGTFVVAQKSWTVQVGPPKSDAVSALLFSSKTNGAELQHDRVFRSLWIITGKSSYIDTRRIISW
jgi:hypothetical protein